jgi:hypothetical protein
VFWLAAGSASPAAAQALVSTAEPPVSEIRSRVISLGQLPPLAPVQQTAPSGPSVGGLFSSIGHDFKTFPRSGNLTWMLAGGGVSFMVHGADQRITSQLSSSSAVQTLHSGGVVGGSLVQIGSAVTVYALGRSIGSPKTATVGADLVRAQVLTEGMVQALKFTAGRRRPDGSNNQSFPSGHTASTFATGAVLQRHFGWKVGIPAYALAGYVAASRMSDNRHYLSDVVFGATLGVLAGRHVSVPIGNTGFEMAPQVVPGGAAVTFLKIGN